MTIEVSKRDQYIYHEIPITSIFLGILGTFFISTSIWHQSLQESPIILTIPLIISLISYSLLFLYAAWMFYFSIRYKRIDLARFEHSLESKPLLSSELSQEKGGTYEIVICTILSALLTTILLSIVLNHIPFQELGIQTIRDISTGETLIGSALVCLGIVKVVSELGIEAFGSWMECTSKASNHSQPVTYILLGMGIAFQFLGSLHHE